MSILVKSDLSVGVGFASNTQNSFQTGCEAALAAMDDHGGNPEALIVFSAPIYKHDQVLEGILSVTGHLPLVGGTTAGEIVTSGMKTQSVVVMALSSDCIDFHTSIGLDMSKDEKACGMSLATNLLSLDSTKTPQSLLIFPNGMGGDCVKAIEGLHSKMGPDFEIVGGCLGDEADFQKTFQFYDGKVYKDAIPGLLLLANEKYNTGVGVRSGFESIGIRCVCTEADGNIIKKIDGEPALKLYKEFLGEERSQKLPGICLEYPFGLIDGTDPSDEKEYFQLRCGLAVDHEEGSISLAASIPEGSAITLTTASRADIIDGARKAAEQAKSSLSGSRPKAIMMFSCVGRKLVLGRRTQEEVDAVQEVFGQDVPLIGFYTYGEIGPIAKLDRGLAQTKFHNETLVLWVLGEE